MSKINPLSNLLFRPLAINDWGAKSIRSRAFADLPEMPRPESRESAERPRWLEMDYLGNKFPEPIKLANGVCKIPLMGPITRGMGIAGQYYGMADTDTFVQWVNEAANDETVSAILIHIQSPGGDAIGCDEAARAVSNAAKQKRVVAFTDDMMASAAYYIGSAADTIYATPSSIIGSIGTYCVIVDDSEYWKSMGVEFEVIRSGQFKGAGIDGWTDEQRAQMQVMVDSFGEQFRGAVDDYRDGKVDRENMEGQVWLGKDAISKTVGIADFVVDNWIQLSQQIN